MAKGLLNRFDLPPVWLVVFMALATGAASLGTTADMLVWPGRVMIVLGLALAIWSALAFRKARTTIIPRERPTALVETGPYRFSRNPIYLADLIILAGWCLSLGFLVTGVMLAGFWWVLEQRFILPEEAVLEADLGAPYIEYKDRVGRWI